MICRVCDSRKLEPVVDLGEHPWCNHFLTTEEVGREPRYPLRLVYCMDCKTAQLDYTVKKEIMFGDHTYLSGITASLNQHFENVATDINERFCQSKKEKTVLDIGSNDGTQLKHFQRLGFRVLGVESSKRIAAMANSANVPTLNAFFNFEMAEQIGEKFDVVNASGVFFHLEELHSVTSGVKFSLKEDGVFVIQFLYMKSIIENVAFDQIYHEHLLYYNLSTIDVLLNRHGLELFDAYLSPIHGGSIIACATHKGKTSRTPRLVELFQKEQESRVNEIETYRDFFLKIQKMKAENLEFLLKAKANGKRVFGLGAPVKGNTMLNYFGITSDLIECLVERNPMRKGLFSPGSHLLVVMEDEIKTPPDIYYVLAWNFKKEILSRNKHLIDAGVEFYFPVNPKVN
ncbi:MAG: class I SAM-dependent methyltransferase [Pseudobdellovibrionaceae bacterium]